ncbi:MAG: PAS domain-containing sensor histidine kinase [Ignavibacteria bacterium]
MLYYQISVAYTIINFIIALVILFSVRRSFISQFYFLCVLFLVVFGLISFSLDYNFTENYHGVLERIIVFLYSLFPFFFIHFIIVYLGYDKKIKSKITLFTIYFAGLFSYTLVLLNLIPSPLSNGTLTPSGYLFYVTWMSIFFTLGVAQLYSLVGGFYEKTTKSRLIFTGFVLLLFLLPGPFSESVLPAIFGNSKTVYYLSSILALTISVYYVFRHKAVVTMIDALKLTLSVLKDIIIKTDHNLKIEFLKGDAFSLIGYKENELTGKHLSELLESSEYLDGYYSMTVTRKMKEGYFEANVIKKAGSLLPVSFSLTPIIDNEVITGYMCIGRDITDIKKYEEILEKKVDERTKELAVVNEELRKDIEIREKVEKQLLNQTQELKEINTSKDKLFSIIAHDLKSPFTAVLGYTEYLSTELGKLTNNEIRAYATNLHKSATSVFKLLDNLLEWSILQTGRREFSPIHFSLNDLIRNIISLFESTAKEKKIAIEFNYEKELTAYADKNMIDSVVRNLISNAIKFSGFGSNINVDIEDNNDVLYLHVKDTGIGIDPAKISRIFSLSANYTREGTNKEKGTGLGLILCKEFMEANNGEIKVESKIGEGSIFTISIPKAKKFY